MSINIQRLLVLSITFLLILFPVLSVAQDEGESENSDNQTASSMSLQELSSEIINPLAKIWRIDFENDTIYNTGDIGKKVWTNTLTFRPRLPVSLDKWILVVEPQIPFIDTQPKFEESILRGITVQHRTGMGDTILATILGRKIGKDLEFGLGPSFIFPTATKKVTGQGKWQAGPAATLFYAPTGWTIGITPQVWWSFAGDNDREETNQMEIQYVIAKHFKNGWNIRSRPTIKADFKADDGDKWNVPVGGGISKLFKLGGKLPVLFAVEAQYSVIKQDTFGPEWTLVSDITVVIPNPQLIRKAKKSKSGQTPVTHPTN